MRSLRNQVLRWNAPDVNAGAAKDTCLHNRNLPTHAHCLDCGSNTGAARADDQKIEIGIPSIRCIESTVSAVTCGRRKFGCCRKARDRCGSITGSFNGGHKSFRGHWPVNNYMRCTSAIVHVGRSYAHNLP
jgi:hypothetical protein